MHQGTIPHSSPLLERSLHGLGSKMHGCLLPELQVCPDEGVQTGPTGPLRAQTWHATVWILGAASGHAASAQSWTEAAQREVPRDGLRHHQLIDWHHANFGVGRPRLAEPSEWRSLWVLRLSLLASPRDRCGGALAPGCSQVARLPAADSSRVRGPMSNAEEADVLWQDVKPKLWKWLPVSPAPNVTLLFLRIFGAWLSTPLCTMSSATHANRASMCPSR